MDDIASVLREAREKKGVSLDEAQFATKITLKYLLALESGQHDALPSSVHLKGYLRNYAKYLEIDPEPLLELYDNRINHPYQAQRHPSEAISPDSPIPPREDNPFFNPVNMELNHQRGGGNTEAILRFVVILALLAAIGLVGYRLFLNSGVSDAATPPANPLTVLRTLFNATFNQADEPGVDQLDLDGIATQAVATVANPLIATEEGGDGAPLEVSSADVIKRLEAMPATDIINVKLEFTERTWVEVTTDGLLVQQGEVVPSGTILEFTGYLNIRIVTGNGRGIFLTLNGEEIGKLGRFNETFNYMWQTTNANAPLATPVVEETAGSEEGLTPTPSSP